MNAPDRIDFLARRRLGLGGSDIAALLGQSKFKTPYQLWLDKTGRADDEVRDPDALERMHWGTVFEDVVARHYAEQTGARVQRINQLLRHPQCEIAIANIDRAVLEDGSRARWDDAAGRVLGASRILEVKTAHAMARMGAEWGDAGTDEVPQAYWYQCLWYLGITGLPSADLAVLFGGQKFVVYTIAADPVLFADLLSEADAWWSRHVIADTPPDPNTEDDARRLWKSHTAGKEKIVDVLVADAVQALADVKAQIKALETEEQELRDVITSEFADAESIAYMGRRLATWRANKVGTKTDWKAACMGLQPTPEHIAHFTTPTEGARVLRINTKE